MSALAIVTVSWAVLCWPWISGQFTIPWDSKAHFLPQLQFLARALASGESPFWAPEIFSGHPQIADAQSLIFSPPFFLLALLDPVPTAWVQDAALYAILLASMAAMLLWLTDKGWHPAAALLSALSFAFGAAMAWRVQHLGQVVSLTYLPMVLLCLDRALMRRSMLWGLGAGVAAACLALGRDQVALLSIYLLIAYVPWRIWTSANPRQTLRYGSLPLLAAALAGAVLIAIPVALTILTAAESNRPSIDFVGAGRGSLHPALFLTMLSADIFGASGKLGEYWGPPSGRWPGLDLFLAQNMGVMYAGSLTACLLIAGVFSGIAWRRDIRLFTIALLITALYGLGWYTPAFKVMHSFLPGVNLYRRPADAVFNIGFLVSVIAGFTLNSLLKDGWPKLHMVHALVIGLIPAAAFAAMWSLARSHGMLETATPVMAIAAVSAAAVLLFLWLAPKINARSQSAVMVLVAIALTADLAYWNGPNGSTALPPQLFEVLSPKTQNDTIALLRQKTETSRSTTRRDRVELVGFGFHWPNASLSHGLENTLGYNPVRSAIYVAATGAGDHAGLPEQKTFSKLFPSYRSMLADMLGLRYIATSVPVEDIDKVLKPGDLTLLAKTHEGYVYENRRALPRVMLASRAERADFAQILETGSWPDFNPESTVQLENPNPAIQGHGGRVVIEAYHNTEITLYADTPDGGYVVLNDMWHPWWVARVDGEERPIEKANVLFRAVAVPPGKHRVVMTFEPVSRAWLQIKSRLAGTR